MAAIAGSIILILIQSAGSGHCIPSRSSLSQMFGLEGVVVLPGVNIGKASIIGANSVVSRDIPANSIAVGNPARVIKQFDFQRGQWVAVDAK